MRVVRYRLQAHASLASETILVEASQTSSEKQGRDGPQPLLLSQSADWLSAEELQRFHVTPLVVRGSGLQQTVDLERNGFFSRNYSRLTIWSEAIAWLEHERPNRLVFAAEPDEVLDATLVLQMMQQKQGPQQPSTGLVSDLPLATWTQGGCAVPRLRGIRYGNDRCPLPTQGFEKDALRGWAQSAYLFSTYSDWASWRGRRSVVLMAEPPEKEWIKCARLDSHPTSPPGPSHVRRACRV